MGEEPGRIREEIEETRERMGDTVDALADKANVGKRMKESVADKRDRLKQQLQGTASRVSDATPDGGDVREGAQRAVGIAEENPLGLAVGGLAAGFLIGMVIPSTKVEDERIGPVADKVKDQARETGQEALERGKAVAQDAAETVREHAQEAASDVKEQVGESARSEAEEMRAGA